jgi:hypothetical protein
MVVLTTQTIIDCNEDEWLTIRGRLFDKTIRLVQNFVA